MSRAVANRLDTAFAGRASDAPPGLIPYITAGYPNLGDTVALLVTAQKAGCIAAEVGIPFSDPLADGPTIQRTGQQAIANGMTLGLALDQVARARDAGVDIPLVVMTYVNPVLSTGYARFAADAARAGVDGAILPDLPFDEAGDLRAELAGCGIALIPLVAPTTNAARLQQICASAAGFVYCVSVTGVTGSRESVAAEAIVLLDAVRGCTTLPRALGFGLASAAHLQALTGHAEAGVVGSALLDAIARDPEDPTGAAARFLSEMLDEASSNP